MLKIYKVGNRMFQFVEGEQPEGAVEIDKTISAVAKAEKPCDEKAIKPANKSRAVKKK